MPKDEKSRGRKVPWGPRPYTGDLVSLREVKKNNTGKETPEGLWTKCKSCEEIIYNKELEENHKVCPKCGYYFRLSARERIALLFEPQSFREYDKNLFPSDPLNFVAEQSYREKIAEEQKKTGLNEAVITGEGSIGQHRAVCAVLDFEFLGGSMGSVVGEKVTRAIEKTTKKKLPLIIVSASGGARMQEGLVSLMQMGKTAAALAKLSKKGLPYISILADPTTGGVSASFAFLGDIILAEPKALIGFAGPRVIEQTIRQPLPEGFQQAEFLLKHGMIDLIVERKEMKKTVVRLLNFFTI